MSLKVSGGGCPRPATRAPGSGLLPLRALVSGRGEWCGPSLSPPSTSFSQGRVGSKAVMLRCSLSQPWETVVALAGSGEAWLGSALALTPLSQLYLFQVPGAEGQGGCASRG